MIQFRGCYVKYGETAALKSLVPGWGQFHNKHYLKGAVFQSIFALAIFSVIYLAVVQIETGMGTGKARALILLGLLLVWEVALFDAYHSAIENRRREAKRIEIAPLVQGCDLHQEGFEEVAVTKTLEQAGHLGGAIQEG